MDWTIQWSRVTIRSRLALVLLVVSCLQLAACSSSSTGLPPDNDAPFIDPNDNIPPPTTEDIANTLLERSDYSTLLLLVERAGLTELLQNDNDGNGWTLFAPSDIAFSVGEDISTLTSEQSRELVELHLFPGTLSTSGMQQGVLNMSSGAVDLEFTDTGIVVGGARIVGRDRVVGNGIIHFVDSVLVSTVN
ncbi:MAG: fasciclin domain-containing protein [Granulosicoccus sp.]